MSRHTPGPWKAEAGGREPLVLAGLTPVAQVFALGESIDDAAEEEANARLIAAAPDLLEALQDALSWIGKLSDWAGAEDPNIERYRTAIAKAEGRP